MDKIAPFIRIGLRVAGGFLIGRGMDPEAAAILYTDPEIAGAIVLAISEGWYLLARRMGWAK